MTRSVDDPTFAASATQTRGDIVPEAKPRHIAIVMDGNGRWAQRQGLPRIEGHRRGVETVRRITEECARLKLEQLTLYSFSTENWKRPQPEVDFLMRLLEQYMIEERSTLMRERIRLAVIGRRDRIPLDVQAAMDESIAMTRGNSGLRLCLAINYGSRAEIRDAMVALARRVEAGTLRPEEITEQAIADTLYTAGMPDPDLLIRTAGELRISNYLLWQISYAELWVTSKCWPEFREPDLHEAMNDFARRNRRFGALSAE